jgi:hypothetical protein
MAWVGCAAILMAALKTDAFATVLIVAFPRRSPRGRYLGGSIREPNRCGCADETWYG